LLKLNQNCPKKFSYGTGFQHLFESAFKNKKQNLKKTIRIKQKCFDQSWRGNEIEPSLLPQKKQKRTSLKINPSFFCEDRKGSFSFPRYDWLKQFLFYPYFILDYW